jgi:hypothetical protein
MNITTEKRNRFSGFLKHARFSPVQFKKVYERQKGNIEGVTIVAPRLGTDDFGSLEVSFRVPVNDPELCQVK